IDEWQLPIYIMYIMLLLLMYICVHLYMHACLHVACAIVGIGELVEACKSRSDCYEMAIRNTSYLIVIILKLLCDVCRFASITARHYFIRVTRNILFNTKSCNKAC